CRTACLSPTSCCSSADELPTRSYRRRFSLGFPSWLLCPLRRVSRSTWLKSAVLRSSGSSAGRTSTSTLIPNGSSVKDPFAVRCRACPVVYSHVRYEMRYEMRYETALGVDGDSIWSGVLGHAWVECERRRFEI